MQGYLKNSLLYEEFTVPLADQDMTISVSTSDGAKKKNYLSEEPYQKSPPPFLWKHIAFEQMQIQVSPIIYCIVCAPIKMNPTTYFQGGFGSQSTEHVSVNSVLC